MKKVRVTAQKDSRELYVFPNIESLFVWEIDRHLIIPDTPCIDLRAGEVAEVEWHGLEMFENKIGNDHSYAHVVRAARKRIPKNANGGVITIYSGWIVSKFKFENSNFGSLIVSKIDQDQEQLNFERLFSNESDE
jgi:hypothetical protein